MLVSCFVRSQVFHLICQSHIRSDCGVCMDNQVVHSLFLFSDFTYKYVAGFMKHAIGPLLREQPAITVSIKSIYRVLHKIKIILTWKTRDLCCLTLLFSQPLQRRWKDEPQGSICALIVSLSRYYLRCWGKPRKNCWTWSVTYWICKASGIRDEIITAT